MRQNSTDLGPGPENGAHCRADRRRVADTQRRCSEAGMVACIAKPVDAEELLTMIAAIVAENEIDQPETVSNPALAVGKAEPLLAVPLQRGDFHLSISARSSDSNNSATSNSCGSSRNYSPTTPVGQSPTLVRPSPMATLECFRIPFTPFGAARPISARWRFSRCASPGERHHLSIWQETARNILFLSGMSSTACARTWESRRQFPLRHLENPAEWHHTRRQ